MTYYKYVGRDASSQVNWADVSKKFSDEISRVSLDRAKKRQQIDKATDDLVDKINEAPTGGHQNANLFTSTLVDQTTEETLRMNRLLKSGEIKPSEYMNYIENQKDSITQLYNMVTEYQSVYKDKMDRAAAGESLTGEVEGMAVVEGFGNFANITPVIDMYGNITMVDEATGETLTVAEQRGLTLQRFDAYDIDTVLKAQADALGEYTKSIMDGTVKTRQDVMQEEGFKQQRNDLVEAALEGNLAVATILDQKLAGYNTTFFPNQAGENDILYIADPRQPGGGAYVPLVDVLDRVEGMSDFERRALFAAGADVDGLIEIARAQRAEAVDWATKDLQNRFDMIETADTGGGGGGGRGPTDAQLKAAEAQRRAAQDALAWMELAYASTPGQKEAAENQLQGTAYTDEFGIRQTISGVDASSFDDRVVITTRNANGEETTKEVFYLTESGMPLTALEWAQSGALFYQDQLPYVMATVPGMTDRDGNLLFEDMTVFRPEGSVIGIDPETDEPILAGKGGRAGVRPDRPALDVRTVDITPFASATVGDAASSPIAPDYFDEKAKTGDSDGSLSATQTALLGSLGAMGVDTRYILGLRNNQVDAAMNDSMFGGDDAPVIRFYIPGATADPLYIPNTASGHEILKVILNRIPQLFQNPLTIEDAKKEFGYDKFFKKYNDTAYKNMNDMFGVPSETTPAQQQSGQTTGRRMAGF